MENMVYNMNHNAKICSVRDFRSSEYIDSIPYLSGDDTNLLQEFSDRNLQLDIPRLPDYDIRHFSVYAKPITHRASDSVLLNMADFDLL